MEQEKKEFNINDMFQTAIKELQEKQEAYFRAQGKVEFLQNLMQQLQPQPPSESETIH